MKHLFLFFALAVALGINAQTNLQEPSKKLTKFELFASKTGRTYKFVDVIGPHIENLYSSSLETTIRIIMGSEKNGYFFRIEKPETRTTSTRIASIEYSDLVEINKALSILT